VDWKVFLFYFVSIDMIWCITTNHTDYFLGNLADAIVSLLV
jgi:hypothetical protein